jgi:hypothetical protein
VENKEQLKVYNTYLAKERSGLHFLVYIKSSKIKDVDVQVYTDPFGIDPYVTSLENYMINKQDIINKSVRGVSIFLNNPVVKGIKNNRIRFTDCYDMFYLI